MTLLAASVLRVSTKKQLNDGDGIENQRRGNDEYIRRQGYTLAREFVVAESASGLERVDFEAVIREVIAHRPQIQVVVFWKVDRISRGGVVPYFTLKGVLAKHGIRVEFATERIDESPTGELMETLLAGMARFENRLRVDRTIGVEKILTKEGYWCRGAPTGFKNGRLDGKPVLVPDTADGRWELLRYGLKMQMTGAFTVSEVADEMRRKGLRSGTGNRLARQTWMNICTSPVYGGMLREIWTDGELIRAKFDGPLTPEEWRQLQRVLGRDRPRPATVRIAEHPEFPLRGFVRCGTCGRPSRGYFARGRLGGRFRYYDCRSAGCGFRLSADQGHRLFLDRLGEVAPTPEGLDTFRAAARDMWHQVETTAEATERAAAEVEAGLQKEKAALLSLMKETTDQPALLTELKADFARVTAELDLLADRPGWVGKSAGGDPETVIATAADGLARVVEHWLDWPLDKKIRLQRAVFPDGLTFDELAGGRTPQVSLLFAMAARPEWAGANLVPQISSGSNLLQEELRRFADLCGGVN